jgi:hypothetical protein
MEEMLKNARPLSEIDLKGLETSRAALDPGYPLSVVGCLVCCIHFFSSTTALTG